MTEIYPRRPEYDETLDVCEHFDNDYVAERVEEIRRRTEETGREHAFAFCPHAPVDRATLVHAGHPDHVTKNHGPRIFDLKCDPKYSGDLSVSLQDQGVDPTSHFGDGRVVVHSHPDDDDLSPSRADRKYIRGENGTETLCIVTSNETRCYTEDEMCSTKE